MTKQLTDIQRANADEAKRHYQERIGKLTIEKAKQIDKFWLKWSNDQGEIDWTHRRYGAWWEYITVIMELKDA